MLVDIEIMVEAEEENNTDEKLEDLDIELEGVNQNGRSGTKKEFVSIPVNTNQIVMLQEMEDGHCLVFFSESFPPVTAKKGKEKLKQKINNGIREFYG
jgi:flagellar basal body-associated protein FliL